MNFTTLEEGFTVIELDNGDRIKLKVIVGIVGAPPGQKDPQGNQIYQINHQVAIFLEPKVRS